MAKNTIYLGPADSANCHALRVEGLAVDAVLPGSLVTQTAAGIATSAKAATAFDSQVLVAEEYGSHVDQGVNDAYTIGDVALSVNLRSGEFANVRVATGNNITTKGTALSSNGDGQFKIAATDGTEQILMYADEVVNVAANNTLVKARKA
tara:strand:+ start:40 stop:489 length:450 start_codon:yes stop_codon:yes gene_type:complete